MVPKKPRLAWLKAFDFWEAPYAPETDHFTSSFDIAEILIPVTPANYEAEQDCEHDRGQNSAGEKRSDRNTCH